MQNKKYPVLFVGAGPGDPELITVKGKNALEQADLVVYAGSLVPETLLKWAENAEAVNSAPLNLDEIISLMGKAVHQGKHVVRLHTGDPSLYGAIYEQMAELDKQDISYAVIPGVTAAFAAAAAMKLEYTLPEITQTLILTRMSGRTKVPEAEHLAKLAAHKAAMAIYLSITLVEDVQGILSRHYGNNFICAVAVKVGHPEERIIYAEVRELAKIVQQEKIKSQALIVVSPGLNILKQDVLHKSRLYDRKFAHEYRP